MRALIAIALLVLAPAGLAAAPRQPERSIPAARLVAPASEAPVAAPALTVAASAQVSALAAAAPLPATGSAAAPAAPAAAEGLPPRLRTLAQAIAGGLKAEPTYFTDGQVRDMTLLRQGRGEALLIFRDPRLDPALHRWLGATSARFAGAADPSARAQKIAEHAARTFSTPWWHPARLWRTRRFRALIARDYARLGDFLDARTGLCRHRAVALQLAFQEAGLRSRLVYGEIRERFVKDGQLLYRAVHAWVEATLPDGRTQLFDPMQGRYAAPIEPALSRPRRFRGRSLSEETRVTYEPAEGSVVYGAAHDLAADDVAPVLRALK